MADRKISALNELTTPVATDVFPIIDVSESANADKNKKIQLTTILRGIPNGSASAPSVGFIGDTGTSGLFRVTDDEIGISCSQTQIASFAAAGLKLGSGTAAAQLHLFSTDTTDQVIIENTDAGTDTAPDFVLFRNSASPADNDNLGNFLFRGKDDNGDAVEYASIAAQIVDASNGSEDGILDLMSTASGTLASRIRLKSEFVGIHEADPTFPLHVSTASTADGLCIESSLNSAGSAADILLFHRRGDSGAGVDNDVLSTITFQGKNDGTNETGSVPANVEYAAIEAVIIDATDDTEDAQLNLQVMADGTLTTKLAIDATGVNITGTVTDDGAVHDGNVDLNGNIDVSGTSTLNDDVTFTGASANILFDKSDNALEFADNAKATLGSSADLQIYHDSTDSFIDNQTGILRIRNTGSNGSQIQLLSNNGGIKIQGTTGEQSIVCVSNSGVELYFNNVKRFETSSNGAACHGRLTMHGDIFSADNHQLMLGNDADLSLLHNGTDSKITNNTFSTSGNLLIEAKGGETALKIIPDGAVEIYHDAVKKVETTSSGITVTGTVTETSDIAYKSDIKPITNTLDKLQQITGYKYKLDNASIDSMGVIAQDVEKVFPELVHGDEGNKTLQYSGLIGVLVEAVKDLSAKVKKLESN